MDLRLAVLSVLVASTISGPVKNLNTNTKCALQCTSKNKFSYRVGTVYEYSYEAETKTGIHGATEDQGGIKATATAEIEVLSKCELLLTVRKSTILGSNPDYPREFKQHTDQKTFKEQLEDHSLRFSFQDGIVEELCPDDGESDWSINFKRGILTAFQNSMDSFDRDTEVVETDVTGKCPTQYRVIQEGWRTIKVKKTKDLVSCTQRHGFQTSAQSTIYTVPSSVQSLPLLKSTQECDQILSTEGRLESTTCHEMHLFRPFSKNNNGAVTEVSQKLTFISEKRGGQIIRDAVSKRESLLFSHHNRETPTADVKKAAIDKLKEMCTATKDGITPGTPRMFAELVYILKELNSQDLTEVYELSQMESFCLENSERVKKFYSDAVPMIGTTAAVKQIAKLILNNEITGRMAEIWLSSLSLVQNPSKEMLREISALMDIPEGIRVYLPASVMINTFCKENKNCQTVPEVEDIINKLQRAVGSGCIVTEGNYIEVLTSLRAIGNLEFADRLVPVLNECIGKKVNEIEIRVAAVEAFRRMSCGADRNNLMIVYRDDSEDSELRISAYIQVMKCPTENIINQIKETLASEEVNQVGSFVWTHLTNLMESSSIHKQAIQNIIEDEILGKEFDLDKRKFSRNYEWSYFSESLNAGAGVESNLIWSQKSFVPRSGMVNLTVELFGHSVNLFEIGGRVEGLEKILAETFAPKGYTGEKQDLTPEQQLSRDVDFNKIKKIDENLGKKDDDLKGAVYMRMFGNEISYYNMKQSPGNEIPGKKPFNFLDIFMNLAKDHEFSQKMSKMLIDSSIITPTVTGLPLNLKVLATSTIDLNAKGKMDLRKPAKTVIMEGSLTPSGAVEVISTMSVDAFVTKSGLKMTSTAYTSTAVKAKVEMDKKQELTVEFQIPKEKSEIINIQSQFFVVHADVEKEQKMITKNRLSKRSCSGATLARVTGVEFCTDMSLPGDIEKVDAPHFPLTGPTRFALIVLKRDSHTSYKFEFKNIMDKKKAVFVVMYDTPGSNIMRRTGFSYEIDHQSKKMEVNMISPWKNASFEGNMVNNPKRKKVIGNVIVDSVKKFHAEASLSIQESKTSKVYKPKVEIIQPGKDPIVLGGEITYRPGKVMSSKLLLTGAMEKPVSLDLIARFIKTQYGLSGTFLYNKDQKYNVDVNLGISDKGKRLIYSPKLMVSAPDMDSINIFGTIQYRTIKGTVLTYDVVMKKSVKQLIKVKGASNLLVKGKRKIYRGNMYFLGPNKVQTKVRYSHDRKLRVTTTMVKLDYNLQKIVKNLKDSLLFNSKLIKKSVKTSQRIYFSSSTKSARFADYNNKVNLKIDHRPNSKVTADLNVDYGKTYMSKVNKHRLSILTDTKYNFKPNTGGTINYNVTFKLPAEKLDSYFSGRHEYSKKKVQSDLHIRYDNKKSADVSINLMDLSRKYFKYNGMFTLKYTGQHIQVSGQAAEQKDEYNMKLDFQPDKDSLSSINAAYSWPTSDKREITSNIKIHKQEPVFITGNVIMKQNKPEGLLKVKVGKKYYVMSGTGNYNGKGYVAGVAKVAYPARMILVQIEGGLKNEEYSCKIDADWDARSKNDQSRVVISGSLRNNTIEDFTLTAMAKYPGRELSANIQHYSMDKLDTAVSVGWNKNAVISTTVRFDKNIKKYHRKIDGLVSVTTPFKVMQEFEIGANHEFNKNLIAYGMTFTWNKGKTVAFQYDSKRPVDTLDIDMNLSMKTPHPVIGNPTISVQNKLTDNSNKQQGNYKLTWGANKYITIETTANILSSSPRRSLKTNLGVTTSFENYKVITLNFTHEDNLKKFLSTAVYVKDGVKYLYVLNMDHMWKDWLMENSGTFDISSPYDSLKIQWNHVNREKDLETTLNADWGRGDKFAAKATANMESIPHRKYVGKIEMTIPSSEFSSLNIGVEHEDRPGYVKSVGSIIANRENVGTVKLNYARQLGSTDFDFRISSKYMREFSIDGKTRHARMPMTGSLKIQWNPKSRIFLDGSLNYDKTGKVDSRMELTTPFQRAKRIVLKATHKLDNLDWVAMSEVEFAPMQKVKAEVRYNTGLEKLFRVQITTPFPQFQLLNAGTYFKFNLYPSQWENKMDFEIVPLVGKMTTETTWRHDTEFKGAFKLQTPFEKIPYMIIEADSKKRVNTIKSNLLIEYLPRQKIEMAAEYTLTKDKDFDGSISLKTPFNDEIFALYHEGGFAKDQYRGLNRRVQLKYKRTQNIVIDTSFGTKPKLFGSIELQIPVRGYETVKLSFTHDGKELTDFHSTLEYDTNGKKIQLEALFDIVGDVKGKLKVTSPFSMKITQVEYSHEGTPTNFKTHAGGIYNDYKVNADAVFSHNDKQTTGSFTLKTPLEGAKDLMLTFNKDGNWKKMTFNGEAGYETGSKYIVAVKHSLEGKDAATDVVIQNPLTDDIIMKVSYDNRKKGFTTIIQGSVGTENSIAVETTYKLKKDNLDLEVEFTSVITGEKQVSNFVLEHRGKLDDFTCKAKLKSTFKSIDEEVKISFKGSNVIDDIDASLDVKDSLKPISFKSGFKSTRKNNAIITEAKYNDNIVRSEVSGADTKYDGKVIVVTKVDGYENFEIEFNHDGDMHKAKNTVIVKPFAYKTATLESDLQFPGITSFGADVKFTSGFKGYEMVETKLSHNGNLRDFDSSFMLKKSDMKPIELAAKLNANDMSSIDGSFKFTSGIKGAEKIEGSLKHSGDLDDITTEAVLLIPNRKPAKFNINLSNNMPSALVGKMALTSDYEGFQNVELSAKVSNKENDISHEYIFNPPFVKQIKVVGKYINTPNNKEVVGLFTSSIEGMEEVRLTIVHTGQPEDFVNTITIYPPFMKSNGMKLTSKLKRNEDYTDIKGDIHFVSAIEGAEELRLVVIHSGPYHNFKNKVTMLSPLKEEIDLSTSLMFKEMENLQMSVDLSRTGVESIGFSTSNKFINKKQIISESEIKLDSLRKIVMNVDGKLDIKDQQNQDMMLKFDLITPFEKARTVNYEQVSSKKFADNVLTQKESVSISHNGEKYYDTQASSELRLGESMVYNYNMEQPYQIEYSYDVHYVEPYSVDLNVNWNKMEPNSNIKIEGKLTDMNDLVVKVIHPTRTGSLEASFVDEEEKIFKLLAAWDKTKNQEAGIVAKWKDQARSGLDILDGSIQVVTPIRNVEVIGSMNNVLKRKSIEGTLLWDAGNDRSKKVSVRTEMTPETNGYSGRMELSLPVIGKELSLTRQYTKNEGSVLYESTNQFSYCTDPSKTIIFTTKLEDVSESGSSNHSYTFGISQAFTKIDTSIMTHLGRSDDRDSVGMLIKYQTSQLQKKNLLMLAEIDKLHKKIILQTVGPRTSGGIMGQIQGDSPMTVTIRGLHDMKDDINTDITVDPKKKAMELKMHYDKTKSNNMLHIAAKYPSKTNFEAQIYRTGDKPQITDSVIKVNLRTTRILHSKIHWRPQSFQDLMNYAVETIEKSGKSFNTEFVATADEMEREITTKYSAISSELESELKPYIDGLSEALGKVQTKLNKMRVYLNKMYKDNDMYVKDVTDGIKEKASVLQKVMRTSVVEMKKAVTMALQKLKEFKNLKNYPFEEKYKEWVNDISTKIQTYKQEMADTLKKESEVMTKKLKESVESLRKNLEEITGKFKTQVKEYLDVVLDKAEVKELMSYIDDVLKNLPDSAALPQIEWSYYINKINQAIKDKLAKVDLTKAYNEVVQITKDAINKQLEPIMQDKDVKELTAMADNLQKKMISAYKRWNIEKTIKGYLIDLYNDLQTYIKEDIAALKFLHIDKNRIIAFDPENGNIEFEIYLPTPADTLESLPKFRLHKYARKIDSMIQKIDNIKLPEMFDFSIWDFYYKYKPSVDPKDWVPPFESFAMVVGSQHFITFDKRKIDFAGRCSYILAKDMVDNRFTAIMNYNGKRQPEMQSLLVLAEGKSVEISSDFSVKLDNRPTELPIKHGKLSVIRDGNLIQIDTGRGLVISGNMANQHIAFVLSGWYFGKVGGILGSYDNEQYNDMIDSTGQVTKDISEMAKTWEVANRCRNSRNIATEVTVQEGKKGYTRCSKLFKNSDSSLRPCFKIVDPTYYMKVCVGEMQTSKGDGCDAVAAYVKQCRQNDVMLWAPKSCITCNAPNKEMFEGGESIKLSPSSDDFKVPKSADVVMVVEQTSCNSDPAKHLGDLVDKVEQELLKKEIKENRYGLIGFGGTPRPAFGRKSASMAHTFEGNFFSESNNFAKGKETLKFGYHFTDPLEAIMTASNMPFRTGVSKTIILLHCGECSDSKNVNYQHLKHVLSTRDITLHILRDKDIRLTGNSIPKTDIMGYDMDRKYTIKPMKDMTSNDIRIPSDSCVSLSLKSGGSVFHAGGLTAPKLRNKKWFLNTVSKRISETASPDECQVCQCVADHTGMAKSVCRKCYSKVSDYLPNWWSTVKHPSKIQDQFEAQFKDYFGEDSWKVLYQ